MAPRFKQLICLVIWITVAACALGACHPPAAARPVLEPENVLRGWLAAQTVQLPTTPAEYRSWWRDLVARCGQPCGTTVRVEEIRFHVHAGRDFASPIDPRHRARGAWLGSLVIVLADLQRWNRRVVEHEMLHLILNLPGESGGHPPLFSRLDLLN